MTRAIGSPMTETVIDDADSVSADADRVSDYADSVSADAGHLSDLKLERSSLRSKFGATTRPRRISPSCLSYRPQKEAPTERRGSGSAEVNWSRLAHALRASRISKNA